MTRPRDDASGADHNQSRHERRDDGDDDRLDDDLPDGDRTWRRAAGSFVLVPVLGEAREQLDAMRRAADPKLAAANSPHLSLIGSSGAGPILSDHSPEHVRACLDAAVRDLPPFTIAAGMPTRFPGTDIVSFELDPHGLLRALHERVK